MQSIAVVLLYFTTASGELLNPKQFYDEVSKAGATHNYDVIFVNLTVPLLDSLTQSITLPKQIWQVMGAISRTRVLCFTELSTDSYSNISPYFDHLAIPIIFYRNSSFTEGVILRTTAVLRERKIAKAVHVVYNNSKLDVVFYTYLSLNNPSTFTNLINPSTSINLYGHQYKIYYKRLFPYFFVQYSKTDFRGLDRQLTETIATYQNATIHFQQDASSLGECPKVPTNIDINIRRTACHLMAEDRVFLPQWDATCVVVPKRHERLVLLQFTKPFQPNVWILSAIYMIVRFFFKFNRWRLQLLVVLLFEFLLTAGYEVKVIQYMTTLRYAPNPRTMAELIARGERFVVGPQDIEFLEAYGNKINMEVEKKSKERYLGQRALLYFCKTAEGYINSGRNYNPQTNDRLMILLRERLRPYPSSYGFARANPLRERFESMLRWVFESGIWRKIYDQYARREEQFAQLVTSEEYLIKFEDLVALWIACGLGWLGAFVGFAVEMVWKWITLGLRGRLE